MGHRSTEGGPLEVQSRLAGNIKTPYTGVCHFRCFFASKPKCNCKCGGVYHGLGKERNIIADKDVFIIPADTTEAIRKKILIKHCRFCGTSLNDQPIRAYEHNGGWKVESHKMGQLWLFITCVKCGYHWTLNKLGLSKGDSF